MGNTKSTSKRPKKPIQVPLAPGMKHGQMAGEHVLPHEDSGIQAVYGEDTYEMVDFDHVYMLAKKLGEGAFGHVHLCVHRKTREKCAVKIVDTSRLNVDDARHLEDEIDILKSLNHLHIVKLFHVFRTPHTIYIVQELCAGGELFDRIVEKSHYNEADARELVKRVLSAVAYAHGEGVVHRDLKPENILLAHPEDDVHIKLADFGLAHRLMPDVGGLATICGSPGYMAPEILSEQPYNEKADVWAVGTIMYCLLGGFNPFEGRSTVITIARIKAGKFSFPSPYFDKISADAKDLIRCMLTVDPEKRLSARACLEHKWFTTLKQNLSMVDLTDTKEKLKEFKAKQKFKAAGNAVIMMNRLKLLSTGDTLTGSKGPSPNGSGSQQQQPQIATTEPNPAPPASGSSKTNPSVMIKHPSIASTASLDSSTHSQPPLHAGSGKGCGVGMGSSPPAMAQVQEAQE